METDLITSVEAARAGDAAAFGLLVKAHMERAYYLTLGMVGNHADAMDVSQNAFYKAFRSIRQLRKSSRFVPWFYAILRREITDFLRGRSRRQVREAGETPLIDAQALRTSEEMERQSDISHTVWDGLRRLPDSMREILVLQHFQGYNYKEIAEAMDIPMGTVASQLYRARNALRRELDDFLEQEH